ncbi:MAG: hypothetical protein HOK41_18585 [Nitrospina sp.]|jgi:hypothetical protein|nr:hypothetical protein [Nitrospina sp.]MBT6717407.1 hypothetical protein [Nitrospina sp.]
MRWKIKFITLIFLCVLPFSAHASKADEYLEFFKKYELLGDTFDLAVADMYSDEANVTVLNILKGVESTSRMKGKKVKEMIHEQMELVKKADSTSDYSNISVEVEGNRATIKATRYSTFKCFTDNKYFMVVEKQTDGLLQIVEEFIEEPIETSCKQMSEKQLAVMLESLVLEANNNFPVMLDSETRLEQLSSEGKTISYHYTMVNFMSSMLNEEKFMAAMVPNLIKQMCSNSTLRTYMDMGAHFEHVYRGKDNMEVATIPVVKTDCKPTDYGM